jgi:hypothetical protein
MKPNTKIVRCQICKKDVGAPGLVLHMRRHQRNGDVRLDGPIQNGNPQPKHPVDSLECIIGELVAKESDIHLRLNELKELEAELQKLSRLRGNLEVMMEQYRGRNEEDKQEHQEYLASQSA